MKIRFVGLLTEAQVSKGLAGYKKIKPAKGIFIKGGLSYTFTFKKDKVSAVTIRRAPQITLLEETDAEIPAPKAEAAATPSPEPSFDEKYASFGEGYNRVVWVKSEAEAKELLKMATEAGYKWRSGDDLLSDISFDDYEEQTAYRFEAETKVVEYARANWFLDRGAEVVKFKG